MLCIFAGLKYYQIFYGNLKDKVELLSLRIFKNKARNSVLIWLDVNLPGVFGAGRTFKNIGQHSPFTYEEMKG